MKTLISSTLLLLCLAGCSAPPAANPSASPVTGTVYTCTMHPEVISDKPGKCPKCNMDLVVKK